MGAWLSSDMGRFFIASPVCISKTVRWLSGTQPLNRAVQRFCHILTRNNGSTSLFDRIYRDREGFFMA